jgi:hypothetical protein
VAESEGWSSDEEGTCVACGAAVFCREGDAPRDSMGPCEVLRFLVSSGRGGRDEGGGDVVGVEVAEGGTRGSAGGGASASITPARSVGRGFAVISGEYASTAPLSPLCR